MKVLVNEFLALSEDQWRAFGFDSTKVALETAFGDWFWYQFQPRCRTCTNPYRWQAEQALLRQLGNARGVLASLPDGHGIPPQSFRRHVRQNHFPLRLIFGHAQIEAKGTHPLLTMVLPALREAGFLPEVSTK